LSTTRVSRLSQILTSSLVGSLASLAIAIAPAKLENSSGISPIEAIVSLVLAASGLAFYVSLGMLATYFGRSWIVWVGLTGITHPIGPIVAYFMMRDRVKHSPQSPVKTSKHCIRCGTLVTAGGRYCLSCGNPIAAGAAESLRADVPVTNLGADLRRQRSHIAAELTRN
jgi:hypothetical protein